MNPLQELSRRKRLPERFLTEHGLSDGPDGRIRIDYGPDARINYRGSAKSAHPSFWDMGPTKDLPICAFTSGNRGPNDTAILVEGPTDALTGLYHGLWAIGVPGATMAKCLQSTDIAGAQQVLIIREPGTGGESFIKGCAKRLHEIGFSGQILETTLGPLKDLSAVHCAFPFHDVFMHFFERVRRLASPVAVEQVPTSSEPRPIVVFDSIEEGLKAGERDAAQIFAKEYGDQVRYCSKAGGWFVWDEQRWKLDDDGSIFRLAGACVDDIARSANTIKDSTNRKNALSLASHLRNRRGIENMLALASKEASIAIGKPERFDSDEWLFNVANGTLDLRTGQLRPHDPNDLITKLSPIKYDPEAACPRWTKFVEEIFAGDPSLAEFLQVATGYSLTGSVREQVFLLLHGQGRNGKSTLLSVFEKLLGDYGASADPSTFIDKRASDGAKNDVARLRGTRFVSTRETTEGQRLAASIVKAFTGGDRLTARFLYGEFFDFCATFKLWLATNHKPIFRGDDKAMARRIRLVPFNQTFEDDRDDKTLALQLEAELSGILNWAIQGCLQWQREGLRTPEAVRQATESYRQENDALTGFFDEKTVIDPKAEVLSSDLYRAYKSWCEASGEKVETQNWFGRRLSDRGFQKKKGRATVSWRGLRLVDDC